MDALSRTTFVVERADAVMAIKTWRGDGRWRRGRQAASATPRQATKAAAASGGNQYQRQNEAGAGAVVFEGVAVAMGAVVFVAVPLVVFDGFSGRKTFCFGRENRLSIRKTGFPARKPGFPTRKPSFLARKPNFPIGKHGVPARKSGFPSGKPSFLAGKRSFPPGKSAFPDGTYLKTVPSGCGCAGSCDCGSQR